MNCRIYDLGRYLVSSESGDDDYLVDVSPGGGCDCIHFRIRVDALKTEVTCKHLERARDQFKRDFPADVGAAILAAQKKPKAKVALFALVNE